MAKVNNVSVVIPVFNEEASLRTLYSNLKKVLASLKSKHEIIFVDDGSNDRSFTVIKGLRAKDKSVKAVRFQRNFGKASALSAGFKKANGSIIFTMDADLQDNPEDIPKFIKELDNGYDLVSGWRFRRNSPFMRKLSSRFYNRLTTLFTGVKLHDFNSGFKAYKRNVVKSLKLYGEMHRYLPILAHMNGFRIGEVKVSNSPRIHGKSKYGTSRLIRGFFDLISVKFLMSYTKRPLHLFGRLGLLFGIIGLLIGLFMVNLWFQGVEIIQKPLLLLAILLMVLGAQFFSIGLLGDMISNNNPREDYVVKDEVG